MWIIPGPFLRTKSVASKQVNAEFFWPIYQFLSPNIFSLKLKKKANVYMDVICKS